jgi:hypothetical protein
LCVVVFQSFHQCIKSYTVAEFCAEMRTNWVPCISSLRNQDDDRAQFWVRATDSARAVKERGILVKWTSAVLAGSSSELAGVSFQAV